MFLFERCGVRKRVPVVEVHTLQRALAAVNEESPICRIVLRCAEFTKKTGDISAVHAIFLLVDVAHVVLMPSTKEIDTRVLGK